MISIFKLLCELSIYKKYHEMNCNSTSSFLHYILKYRIWCFNELQTHVCLELVQKLGMCEYCSANLLF